MSELAIIERTPIKTLATLAETANAEHRFTVGAALSAVEHAVRGGEALIEARSIVGAEGWHAWLGKNFHATHHTASHYMRIAAYHREVREAGITGIFEALRFLAGRPQLFGGPGERAQQARQLRSAGRTVNEIAAVLGVRSSTVDNYLNPKKAQERSERSRRRRLEAQRALDQQKRDREIKAAARAAGGAIAALYADTERMQDTLGRASREAKDARSRHALDEAGMHYRKMRDEIVRALLGA